MNTDVFSTRRFYLLHFSLQISGCPNQ
jgi:hypothetical protein